MSSNFFRGLMKPVFVLTSIILLSSSVIAVGAQSIQVYAVPMQFTFDEEELAPPADQQGFIYNNSTYLPLRFVVHSLGQAVEWDNATSTVTIREPESDEQTEIDAYNKDNQSADSNAAITNTKPKLVASSIQIFKRKVTYKLNGKTIIPNDGLEGFIVNDRLFVPLRFVSSSIGYEVAWDPKTYSVAMQSPAFIAEKLEPPVIIGGGGGVSTSKPTESSIISQAEGQIRSLRTSCQNSLFSIYLQFASETDSTAKQALKSQAIASLASCDTEFEAIMTSLQSTLTTNGYPTDIIASYRDSYAEEKALAESALN